MSGAPLTEDDTRAALGGDLPFVGQAGPHRRGALRAGGPGQRLPTEDPHVSEGPEITIDACPECRSAVFEGERFCEACGYKLAADVPEPEDPKARRLGGTGRLPREQTAHPPRNGFGGGGHGSRLAQAAQRGCGDPGRRGRPFGSGGVRRGGIHLQCAPGGPSGGRGGDPRCSTTRCRHPDGRPGASCTTCSTRPSRRHSGRWRQRPTTGIAR